MATQLDDCVKLSFKVPKCMANYIQRDPNAYTILPKCLMNTLNVPQMDDLFVNGGHYHIAPNSSYWEFKNKVELLEYELAMLKSIIPDNTRSAYNMLEPSAPPMNHGPFDRS